MKRSFVFWGAAAGALSLLLGGTAADDAAARGAGNGASYADYARFEEVATQGVRGAAVNNNPFNNPFVRAGDNFAARFVHSSAGSFSQIVESEVGLAAFQNHLHRQLTSGYEFDAADWAGNVRSRIESTADALPLRAADTLTDALLSAGVSQAEALRFVREVEAEYQSELGGRKWQAGASALGSLRETKDNVFAWQLRGFAAQDSTTGANAGLIYRSVVGNALWGGNVFLDFEDGEYGEFFRWSFGLESKTKVADFYLNHYVPITSERALSGGRVAYSKQGWDAGLGLHLWEHDIFSGGVEYYNFQGEYGQADDSGLRGFVEARPPQLAGLQLRVEYDDDSGDFGGDVVYRYRLDAAAPASAPPQRVQKFNPREHFYAPVRREWSQRIGIATLVAPLGFVGGGTQGIALSAPFPPSNTNAPLFTVIVQGGDNSNYAFGIVQSNPEIQLASVSNNNEVIVQDAGIIASQTNSSYEVSVTDGSGDTATLTLAISFDPPPSFVGGTSQIVPTITDPLLYPRGAPLFTLTAQGGEGAYAFTLVHYSPQIVLEPEGNNRVIVKDAGGNAGIIANEGSDTFRIRVTDGNGATADVLLEISVDFPQTILSRMVLIGGQANGSPLSDVWSSAEVTEIGEANGAAWAAVPNGELSALAARNEVAHAAVVFNERIYVIGGNDTGTYSEVYSYGDSSGWQNANNSTLPRLLHHGAIVFNDSLFVIGGGSSNEVWASADGSTWTQQTPALHSAVSAASRFGLVTLNNRLYLIGGRGSGRENWVWESEDGITWRSPDPTPNNSTVDACPGTDSNGVFRAGFQEGTLEAVSFKGKIYIFETELRTQADLVGPQVWSSSNGCEWTLETLSNAFPVREAQSVFALDEDGDGTEDAIYVVGGAEIVTQSPLTTGETNTVFRSTDGTTWSDAITQTFPFIARRNATPVIFHFP